MKFPEPPAIPGHRINPQLEEVLRGQVHNRLGLKGSYPRFPGSQPVSFGRQGIQALEEQDYWVCEKTDGLRVLLLSVYAAEAGQLSTFLVDRNNSYYQVETVYFPQPGHIPADRRFGANMIDGELVTDLDPQTGRPILRYYAFDALLIWGDSVLEKPLTKRYGALQQDLLDWVRRWRRTPESAAMRAREPFEVVCKPMQRSYGLGIVLEESLDPARQKHKSDGLIFSRANAPYKIGSTRDMLKWKPADENSVDFRLHVYNVGGEGGPGEGGSEEGGRGSGEMEGDLVGALNIWIKDDDHQPWGILENTPTLVQEWTEAGVPYEGRIVEASYLADNRWAFMRFRDDKEKANHITVAQSVKESIEDNITEDTLKGNVQKIRGAWKDREANASSQP
ncbi:mRNA capping enzyme, catalytic domain-containing protein [Piptocephalis cylindrospora]|uniref:mRNA guanylyltransferase n=1 Tax=Piptocephalis cylindrospora TaxID=1907219 RepID=A0A4P9Y1J2_9FUNG|nr:mRNA capping enzyme, catalytic domain-containing protein [Piptocephalis cylindrospora]|eukprot:RKP12633.1 mRNA capping enzyme, catalytic domain-containing protein [Piptocephalis cylindrospora]